MENGLLIVISGPSGVGKGTIIDALTQDNPDLSFSVSATTRPARTGESEGVQYHFVTLEQFEQWIKEDKFLEWARVHDAYYGTPREWVEKKVAEGGQIILDIDVQGSLQVKKRFPDGVFIFVAPPTFEELKRRLENRHTENPGEILHRLENAKQELRHAAEYNYLVINDVLEEAVADVTAIIRAEKCKLPRRLEEVQNALSPS